jgi:hypothetical protein
VWQPCSCSWGTHRGSHLLGVHVWLSHNPFFVLFSVCVPCCTVCPCDHVCRWQTSGAVG